MPKVFNPEYYSAQRSWKPAMRHKHGRILAAIRRALGGLAYRVAQARKARRAFEELNAMSDLELADIGIIRGDIPAVIARTHWDAPIRSSNVVPFDRRRCRSRSSDVCARPAGEPGNAA